MFFGLFTKKPKIVKVKRKVKPKESFQTRKSSKKKRLKKVRAKKGITRAKKRKRPAVKKVKKIARLKAAKIMPQITGKVTHYFPHVKAGVILITSGKISLGDTLQIKGHTTDLKQKVNSMQTNNIPIKEAKAGQEIGLLVKSRVRQNDVVYKI
jgi:hypothetical protein